MATDREQLSTWLPTNEADALRELATSENRSVSQMIRLIVLDRLSSGAAAATSAGTGSSAATKGTVTK